MANPPRNPRILIAGFELDLVERTLRNGEKVVRLPPQPFKALALLAGRPGRLVTREEFRAAIWGEETVVDFEHGLNTCIRQVREALGEEAENAQIIETVPRIGYRCTADVTHEEPRRSLRPVLLTAAVVVVAGASLATVWIERAQAARPVVAVLPFKNLSIEANNEFFADGLTDEIVHNLSVIDGLDVRSSMSSFALKNTTRSVREVGRQLGADYLVEGSVVRSGDTLRIHAEFVRVADEVPLWSERFDRELKDVFAIQDDISRAIVNQLRLKLGRGQRRYNADAKTYDLYLNARGLLGSWKVTDAQRAAGLLDRVTATDPAFAPAYGALATAWALMSMNYGGVAPREGTIRMRAAAERATELDPLLGEAHAAMGLVFSRDGDWKKSERAFRRAIELDPTLISAYTNFSAWVLLPQGRFDEAQRQLQAALRIDPMSAEVRRVLANVQISAGRYDEAIANCQAALAADPAEAFSRQFMARALLQKGEMAEAIRMLETQGVWSAGYLGFAYGARGERRRAEALAVENASFPARTVLIYAGLGDRVRAYHALEAMAKAGDPRVGMYYNSPELRLLHRDSDTAAVLKRLGLPAGVL